MSCYKAKKYGKTLTEKDLPRLRQMLESFGWKVHATKRGLDCTRYTQKKSPK